MNNEITLTLTGNVTSAPELRYTPSGAPVASFRVAVTPRVKRGDTWSDGETTFLACTAWRELAENIAETIDQGARVIVTGNLRTERWQGQDGEQRERITLQVEDIGPSLRYATAKVAKVQRGNGGQRSTGQQAPPPADPFAGMNTTGQTADPWSTPSQQQAVQNVATGLGGQPI